MKFRMCDLVELSRLSSDAPHIPIGTRGLVVDHYDGTDAYNVDFVDENGDPYEVVVVREPNLRLIRAARKPQPIYPEQRKAG